jgi:hypothetical protein
MTAVLNPELAKESLVNGNTFLTAFYKLSRCHEKILLGLPFHEDINDINILRVGQGGGGLGGIGDETMSEHSGVSGPRTAPGKLRRGMSRGVDRLPKLTKTPSQQQQQDGDDLYNNSGSFDVNSRARDFSVGPDMLSSFKYSGVFLAPFDDDPSVDTADDYPFGQDSPRSNGTKLKKDRLPSPFSPDQTLSPNKMNSSAPGGGGGAGGGGGGGGMLARMFSGVNPWTANEDDLGSIGVTPPQRYGSPASRQRTASDDKNKQKKKKPVKPKH